MLLLAALFLAFHLPYLPASLEDLDSINFALGVRHFDVAHHQPHPPGYPLFIVAAKAAHALIPSEAKALAAVSIAAGTLGVIAIAALFRRLEPDRSADAWPLAATAVAMTAPLYWFTTARPLSDVTGLAAALAVQALTVSATTPRMFYTASFCAALAAGLRSQVVWLTLPLLIVRTVQRFEPINDRAHEGARPSTSSGRALMVSLSSHASSASFVVESLNALLAYATGIVVWAVPLLLISGGPAAYWRALSNQGAEDLSGIRMLWTTPDARELVDALYYAFVAPWAVWPLATIVLALAALGLWRMYRNARGSLVWLAVAFAPYFAFDLLFQETFTSRYAVPLVVPIAYLVVAGARWLPRHSGLAVAMAIAISGAHIGGTSVAALARQPAPAFRLLDALRDASPSLGQMAALAMDRREDLDLRRPIVWIGDAMPRVARRLPSPPQHEWLELAKYWNSGGRAPVWFVADPLRTDIDLVQHARPSGYRWQIPYPVLIGGVRPNEMDWYRLDRPDWYVGEGWALTPESAGVSDVDGRGLSHGAIQGWVRRDLLGGGALAIGGRNFEATVRPRVRVAIGRMWTTELTVAPGAFVEVSRLPFIDVEAGVPEYLPISVSAAPPSRIAIEQFDASRTRPVFAFGDGWHEQEFNPQTGLRWRWLSERGELRAFLWPAQRIVLHLEGESPRRYFSRPSRLVVRSTGRVWFDDQLSSNFALDIPIAAGLATPAANVITLETDQTYVPAERGWRRTADRRHLGLRIFKCELRGSG